MKRLMLLTLAAIAAVGLTAAAQVNSAKMLLEAAKKAEIVDGDLKGAIERYKAVVSAAGGDRAVAAEALVRMADCYSRVGDAEARALYARVARDYADQKEFASLAQAKLGNAAASPLSMTSRRVASVGVGGIGYGTVSPDGRYFPYTNWNNGDLYVRDLTAGSDRRLTNVSGIGNADSQFAVQAAFSRDGRQIAYQWANGLRSELRLLTLASPSPRTLFTNDDVRQIWPDDWSPDGQRLAVQLRRQDKTAQLGFVTVADGTLHVVKSIDWRAATRVMFSPDGKYLAFDLPVSDTDEQRDVFILAVDGSRELPAVVHPAHDTVMGWSPDGQSLLFASDRGGSRGLWQVAVADGRPRSQYARLIKPNLEGAPLGMTSDGRLYSLMHHPSFSAAQSANIRVASFDFENGRFLSEPTSPIERFVDTNNFPAWSPDGSSLAYVSAREQAAASAGVGARSIIIGIRSSITGQTREFHPAVNLYPAPALRWSADGRSLVTHGRDSKGRFGIFRIDAQTGDATVLVMSPDDGDVRWPSESPDGKHLYYLHGYSGNTERPFRLIDRELASGAEREILRSRSANQAATSLNIFMPSLSPDGEHIVLLTENAAEKSTGLAMVPVRGGAAVELIRASAPQRVAFQSWTPDSGAVLAKIVTPGRPSELWRVPLAGGERRKLELNPDDMTVFSVHPDGHQIAYGLTERAKEHEVWVLENFLPPAPASPSRSQRRNQ